MPTSAERERSRRKPARMISVEELPFDGAVESIAFLGPSVLLVVLSMPGTGDRASIRGAIVEHGIEHRVVGWRVTTWSAPDLDSVLMVLTSANEDRAFPATGTLVRERAGEVVALTPVEVIRDAMPLEEFTARHLLSDSATAGVSLLDELITLVAKRSSIAGAAKGLAAIRDGRLLRYPIAEVHPAAEFAAQIDGIWRVDASSFYVEGWLFDRRSRLDQFRLLSPEGRSVRLLDRMSRYRRSDVSEFLGVTGRAETGFIAFVELPEESTLNAGWVLQGVSVDGFGFEATTPSVIDDPEAVRTVILDDLQLDAAPAQEMLARQTAPAITRLQRRLSETIEVDWVDQHGAPPVAPAVSVVIPLYQQTDWVEHQLAQFVLDPEMSAADVIYVLDSPQDAVRLRPFAEHLFNLYRVPFRLAAVTANGGYSVANNLGATLARGRMLLMLNSDVLPSGPGWLSPMVEAYDSNPKIGVLAPKLLYEDDSIQHAGLYFDRASATDAWWNEHYFKGLHRSFPAANVARAVPAVTGACMMIATELFRSLGGLRGMYIRGDYEDSDLCLRLREQGLLSWYLPEVELYHLEGQSYPSRERETASQFNRLLHSDVWRAALMELDGQE